MSLPSFDTKPTTFVLKKSDKQQDVIQENRKDPEVHHRQQGGKRYSCGYLVNTKPCGFETDSVSGLRSHENTHLHGYMSDVLQGDLIRMLIPKGAREVWVDEFACYVYAEHIKLPPGYRVLSESPHVVNREVFTEKMINPIRVDMVEITLVKSDQSDLSPTELNRLEKKIKTLETKIKKLEATK